MKEIWKYFADILQAVRDPYSLLAFILFCILIVLLYKKGIRRAFVEKIIFYLMGLIILLFIINLSFNYFKSNKTQIDETEYLMNEDFENNQNKWDLGNSQRVNAKIEDGLLILSSNSNAWYPRSIIIPYIKDNIKNLQISCKFKVLQIKNLGFGGLYWGLDKEQNSLCLMINNNKELYLGIKPLQEGIIPILNWNSNFNIKNNDFNEIIVESINNQVKIYINEALITNLPSINFHGSRIGFCLENSEIKIDYLRIKEIL